MIFQAPQALAQNTDRAAYSFQKEYNCFCCRDSGFAVLRQAEIDAVMPDYDPHTSPPIYCNRRTCHGRKQFATSEHGTDVRWDIPVGGADYSRVGGWPEFCEALHAQRLQAAIETDKLYHQRRQEGASPENESGLRIHQMMGQAQAALAEMPRAESAAATIAIDDPTPPDEVKGFRVGDRVRFDISGFSKTEQRDIRNEGTCPSEGKAGVIRNFSWSSYAGTWRICVEVDGEIEETVASYLRKEAA